MDIALLLESLRNLSYGSGWMSGKIETSSKSPDLLITEAEEARHGQLISDRNDIYVALQNSVLNLKQQNADLVAALEKIDRILSKRQGMDWDYGSQEEHDIHEIARQALTQVKEE